jgi:hypothetical protein
MCLKKTSLIAVPDEAFSAALKRIRSMTKPQRIESLKNTGILTPSGNFSKPYQAVPA